MKKSRQFLRAVAAAAVLVVMAPSVYGISWSIFSKDAEYFRKVQGDPKRLVEEYCEAEFNGVQDIRMKVVNLSPKQEAAEKKESPEQGEKAGKVISIYSDPLVIVNSYRIRGVSVQDNHAEAVVVYQRLASSGGIAERRYAAERNDNDVVKLTLDYDGSRWWIKDPPMPRVSKWALLEFSERIISSMDNLIRNGKASEGQKKYYQNNKEVVLFLKSL